jgi:hypothetical protein
MTCQLHGNWNSLQIEAPDVGIWTEICCEILYMLMKNSLLGISPASEYYYNTAKA